MPKSEAIPHVITIVWIRSFLAQLVGIILSHDVPSFDSESFGSPSPPTKQAVLLRDQSKCWLCKNENLSVLDAAHQMPPTMVSRVISFTCSNFSIGSELLKFRDNSSRT